MVSCNGSCGGRRDATAAASLQCAYGLTPLLRDISCVKSYSRRHKLHKLLIQTYFLIDKWWSMVSRLLSAAVSSVDEDLLPKRLYATLRTALLLLTVYKLSFSRSSLVQCMGGATILKVGVYAVSYTHLTLPTNREV